MLHEEKNERIAASTNADIVLQKKKEFHSSVKQNGNKYTLKKLHNL